MLHQLATCQMMHYACSIVFTCDVIFLSCHAQAAMQCNAMQCNAMWRFQEQTPFSCSYLL